ncbi:hypothetical protein DRE_07619 [Drechslerella stenobrocha 248]|uniref:F-box domain-containing protein n=1 Tax=Drechslerella stenobrocha 248 TaxID=1043628 RepID=W7HU11_9PEZI|nr:hypothetical protein DRE_07619 [Drechslerella stenobrocha 248]
MADPAFTPFPINNFPHEIIDNIIECMPTLTLTKFSETCKRFYYMSLPVMRRTFVVRRWLLRPNYWDWLEIACQRNWHLVRHLDIHMFNRVCNGWGSYWCMLRVYTNVTKVDLRFDQDDYMHLTFVLSCCLHTYLNLKTLKVQARWRRLTANVDKEDIRCYTQLPATKKSYVENLTIVTEFWDDETCDMISKVFGRTLNAIAYAGCKKRFKSKIQNLKIEIIEPRLPGAPENPFTHPDRSDIHNITKGNFKRLRLRAKKLELQGVEKFALWGLELFCPTTYAQVTDLTIKWSHYNVNYIHLALEKLKDFPVLERLHVKDESFNYSPSIGRNKYCFQNRLQCSQTIAEQNLRLKFIGWYRGGDLGTYNCGDNYRYGWNIERTTGTNPVINFDFPANAFDY